MVLGRTQNTPRQPSEPIRSQGPYTFREGQFVQTDQAFDAWTLGDLEMMKEALSTKTNLVDRHFLLMNVVDMTYKRRKEDEKSKNLCIQTAEQHIEEFPKIKPALVKDFDGTLPRVTTFQKYATLLSEQGDFTRAIEVCELAISHGLHDGTKGGFESRIARIKKKAGVQKA